MASNKEDETAPPQTVRFKSDDEEVDPKISLEHIRGLTDEESLTFDQLPPESQEEIRNLSKTMQKCVLQSKRMENFSFEPVSLPPSRAPSPAPGTAPTIGGGQIPGGRHLSADLAGKSPAQSPMPSPPVGSVQSPPLTPAGSDMREDRNRPDGRRAKETDPAMITPQASGPHEPPPTTIKSHDSHQSSISATSPSPHPSPRALPRHKPENDVHAVAAHPRHTPSFSIGPAGDSFPPSQEPSPSASPGPSTPGVSTPGTSTPAYGRPITPSSERDDTVPRGKRIVPQRHPDAIDPRMLLAGRDPRKSHHQSTSTTSAPRSSESVAEVKVTEGKRHSSFFGSRKHDHHQGEKKAATAEQHHHGSMSELKRFFKLGGHKHKDKDKEKEKRAHSPAVSEKSKKSIGTMHSQRSSVCVPFADDHGLEKKYGKFGKMLGSGAGGSVRLMKRSSDGTTFAVKQFRDRHTYESEKDYSKKVTAEFCVGSTMHHGNIIETMDLVHEKGKYYVVMEYAPFDLFAIVMTGKMSREEVTCSTLQILSGVTYLHGMGLAHRDLKLDNVVVNEHGIMKIIDFGSAAVFRYPFDDDISLASGIVGSDPYLAPEVYDNQKYDPRPADIWSMAIIFCCMTLRRFPWKQPRLSDNSYKLFVSTPDDGSPGSVRNQAHGGSYSEPTTRDTSDKSGNNDDSSSTHTHHNHHNHHNHRHGSKAESEPVTHDHHYSSAVSVSSTTNGSNSTQQQQQQQQIRGPWRLLRLLPRETRHIIGRMLEVDPRRRATLDEVLADKWVMNAAVCRQEEGGQVVRAEGHDHTLEPGAGGDPKT